MGDLGGLGDSLNSEDHGVCGYLCMARHKVTLGGICLPFLVALSGFAAHPLERQDTHLLGLLLEAELSLGYFVAVAVFMVWQVRKNISYLDNSVTSSFVSSSSTRFPLGNSHLQRALGSLTKPRTPVLEPTAQTSQSQQRVSEFLHPEPGCGVCLLSQHGLSILHCPTPVPSGLFSQADVEPPALGSEVLEPDQGPGECLCWVQLQPCLFRGLLTVSAHGQSRAEHESKHNTLAVNMNPIPNQQLRRASILPCERWLHRVQEVLPRAFFGSLVKTSLCLNFHCSWAQYVPSWSTPNNPRSLPSSYCFI